MTEYFEMWHRKRSIPVRVYCVKSDGTAMIWSDGVARKQNGSGWETVLLKHLVPLDKKDLLGVPSKSLRNRAKERLKIVSATWRGSDGTLYDHSELNEAIEHEIILLEAEDDN